MSTTASGFDSHKRLASPLLHEPSAYVGHLSECTLTADAERNKRRQLSTNAGELQKRLGSKMSTRDSSSPSSTSEVKFRVTHGFQEALIEAVRQQPALWDPRHPSCLDWARQDEVWGEVGESLNVPGEYGKYYN